MANMQRRDQNNLDIRAGIDPEKVKQNHRLNHQKRLYIEEMKEQEEMRIWVEAGRDNGVSKKKALADHWQEIKRKKVIPKNAAIDVNTMIESKTPYINMVGQIRKNANEGDDVQGNYLQKNVEDMQKRILKKKLKKLHDKEYDEHMALKNELQQKTLGPNQLFDRSNTVEPQIQSGTYNHQRSNSHNILNDRLSMASNQLKNVTRSTVKFKEGGEESLSQNSSPNAYAKQNGKTELMN